MGDPTGILNSEPTLLGFIAFLVMVLFILILSSLRSQSALAQQAITAAGSDANTSNQFLHSLLDTLKQEVKTNAERTSQEGERLKIILAQFEESKKRDTELGAAVQIGNATLEKVSEETKGSKAMNAQILQHVLELGKRIEALEKMFKDGPESLVQQVTKETQAIAADVQALRQEVAAAIKQDDPPTNPTRPDAS
jgi:cysteinyl-tRNA synthetase